MQSLKTLIIFIGLTAVCFGQDSITISGFLEDIGGIPMNDRFNAEVKFYETSTSTIVLQTDTFTTSLAVNPSSSVVGGVKICGGVFAFDVVPTSSVLALDVIWYSLAIDTNENGLDAGDLFEERFKINAVPLLLKGKIKSFWATHGHTSTWKDRYHSPHLAVSPFIVPAGGVKFNVMSADVSSGSSISRISFGIYDRNGNSIALTGLQTIPANTRGLWVVKLDKTIFLEPAELYFTGVGNHEFGGLAVRDSIVADSPLRGAIRDLITDGLIPNSFNPDMIEQHVGSESEGFFQPISITLSYIEE